MRRTNVPESYLLSFYDNTSLDVKQFVPNFLGDYELMSLSTCFRLSAPYAAMLGSIWQKNIIGVNKNFKIKKVPISKAFEIAANTNPADLLCLGSRNGEMVTLLNLLEEHYPEKFNKKTVYASIRDTDVGTSLSPADDVAIFTTFDSSKGLEKPICLLFDYSQKYYESRADKSNVRYEILRNVFCVAASRAKKEIVYVVNDKRPLLLNKQLSTPFRTKHKRETLFMSEMFDFKYKEAVDACYGLLDIEELEVSDKSPIEVVGSDWNIDLLPCIGIYQEVSYFSAYNYDKALQYFTGRNEYEWGIAEEIRKLPEPTDLREKVLYITACSTLHMRYAKQVVERFISEENTERLHARLAEVLGRDELVQVDCELKTPKMRAKGLCDVLVEDTVYELKFVHDLSHEHFLQLACYMYALNKPHGVLWNTRNNQRYLVRIPDRENFLQYVEATVNKQSII